VHVCGRGITLLRPFNPSASSRSLSAKSCLSTLEPEKLYHFPPAVAAVADIVPIFGLGFAIIVPPSIMARPLACRATALPIHPLLNRPNGPKLRIAREQRDRTECTKLMLASLLCVLVRRWRSRQRTNRGCRRRPPFSHWGVRSLRGQWNAVFLASRRDRIGGCSLGEWQHSDFILLLCQGESTTCNGRWRGQRPWWSRAIERSMRTVRAGRLAASPFRSG